MAFVYDESRKALQKNHVALKSRLGFVQLWKDPQTSRTGMFSFAGKGKSIPMRKQRETGKSDKKRP